MDTRLRFMILIGSNMLEKRTYILNRLVEYAKHCGIQLWIDGLTYPPEFSFMLSVDLKKCWRSYILELDMIDDLDKVVDDIICDFTEMIGGYDVVS